MVNTNFKGTQQDLYAICKLAWHSCSQHLADFTAFKTKYDATFITDNLAVITTTEELADAQARYAASEVLRIHLAEFATASLNNWQNLKRYIADAFPPAEQKARLEEAGHNYYLKAGQDSWDNVQGLLTSAQQFITTHDAILQSDGFMPVTFTALFSTNKTAFNTQHQLFLDSEETAKQATQTKQTANNKIHSNLMTMLLDGQEIFKENEAVQEQFIYTTLLNTVSGTGQSDLKGKVTSQDIDVPILNANIIIRSIDKNTLSDKEGNYELKPIPVGTYNVQITADGYQEVIIEKQKVISGTVSTLNIEMIPIDQVG